MSLDDLREELLGYGDRDPAWVQKMCHAVPDAPVVKRVDTILKYCEKKTVLNLGCASGPLHRQIQKVATVVYGIDKDPCGHKGCKQYDFDRIPGDPLPSFPYFDVTFDLLVAGEILEHLSNPGYFLDRLHQYHAPLLITVPNAFSSSAQRALAEGVEEVNRTHVAWYSWHTLKTLLSMHGFVITTVSYYNGRPRVAEGLVVMTEERDGAVAAGKVSI